MFEGLKRVLGLAGESARPYRGLSDEELVGRYAEARARVNDRTEGWRQEDVDECWHLMAEWERRDNDPNALDRAADDRTADGGSVDGGPDERR